MPRGAAIAVALVVLAGCGSEPSTISAGDKSRVDRFWDGQSDLDHTALCSEIADPGKDLQVGDAIARAVDDAASGDADPGDDRDQRAEAIAEYLRTDKC